MTAAYNQWTRRVGLIVFAGERGMDLSAFRIRFSVQNADVESPNSCAIRVYNLSRDTVARIRGEFSSVTLNAGYEGGDYGVIFQGSIKQFRIGRENATDTYLDILAADGDIGYNQGIINTSFKSGSTQAQMIEAIAKGMPDVNGVDTSSFLTTKQYTPNIRGTVMFGMARARLRNIASNLDASWSIQDGKVVFLDNTGYRDGEAVVINVNTGMVGMPEQTDGGIRVSCLLKSRLRIGNLLRLNNEEIRRLYQQNPNQAPVPYNQWTGIQFMAPLSPDGTYRAFVVEHEGDSRGNMWQTNIICLAVDLSAPRDKAVSSQ